MYATLLVACTLAPDPAPTYESVADQVILNRRNIRTCALHLKWVRDDHSAGTKQARAYQMWLSGDTLRADHLPVPDLPPTDQRYSKGRSVVCRNCLGANLTTRVSILESAVQTSPRGQSPAADEADALFDPRMIGLLFEGLFKLPGEALESCLNHRRFSERAARTVERDGRPAVELAAVVKGLGEYRAWLDPARGHNFTRFELNLTWPGAGTRVAVTHDVDLAQDPVSKVWFPARLRYHETRGGRPHTTEVVEVLAAELNRPVDPAVFTLAGFGLPRGNGVYPIGSNTMHYWDGAKVVKESPITPREVAAAGGWTVAPGTPPIPVDPPMGYGRWLWAAPAAVFGLFGGWLVHRGLRR